MENPSMHGWDSVNINKISWHGAAFTFNRVALYTVICQDDGDRKTNYRISC